MAEDSGFLERAKRAVGPNAKETKKIQDLTNQIKALGAKSVDVTFIEPGTPDENAELAAKNAARTGKNNFGNYLGAMWKREYQPQVEDERDTRIEQQKNQNLYDPESSIPMYSKGGMINPSGSAIQQTQRAFASGGQTSAGFDDYYTKAYNSFQGASGGLQLKAFKGPNGQTAYQYVNPDGTPVSPPFGTANNTAATPTPTTPPPGTTTPAPAAPQVNPGTTTALLGGASPTSPDSGAGRGDTAQGPQGEAQGTPSGTDTRGSVSKDTAHSIGQFGKGALDVASIAMNPAMGLLGLAAKTAMKSDDPFANAINSMLGRGTPSNAEAEAAQGLDRDAANNPSGIGATGSESAGTEGGRNAGGAGASTGGPGTGAAGSESGSGGLGGPGDPGGLGGNDPGGYSKGGKSGFLTPPHIKEALSKGPLGEQSFSKSGVNTMAKGGKCMACGGTGYSQGGSPTGLMAPGGSAGGYADGGLVTPGDTLSAYGTGGVAMGATGNPGGMTDQNTGGYAQGGFASQNPAAVGPSNYAEGGAMPTQSTEENMKQLYLRAAEGDKFARSALEDMTSQRLVNQWARDKDMPGDSLQRGSQSAQDFMDTTRQKHGIDDTGSRSFIGRSYSQGGNANPMTPENPGYSKGGFMADKPVDNGYANGGQSDNSTNAPLAPRMSYDQGGPVIAPNAQPQQSSGTPGDPSAPDNSKVSAMTQPAGAVKDQEPAMLSKGEYVLDAATVAYLGVNKIKQMQLQAHKAMLGEAQNVQQAQGQQPQQQGMMAPQQAAPQGQPMPPMPTSPPPSTMPNPTEQRIAATNTSKPNTKGFMGI